MHLIHPDHAVGTDGVGQAFPVGRHGGRGIADVITEIEGVIGRPRDTALAGGRHAPNPDGHGV
jgi:hypothetical protein